jgi:hypothetical protein
LATQIAAKDALIDILSIDFPLSYPGIQGDSLAGVS